jgi:hypothetical protein
MKSLIKEERVFMALLQEKDSLFSLMILICPKRRSMVPNHLLNYFVNGLIIKVGMIENPRKSLS